MFVFHSCLIFFLESFLSFLGHKCVTMSSIRALSLPNGERKEKWVGQISIWKLNFPPFTLFLSFFLSLQRGLSKKREREKMQKNPFVDLSTLMQRWWKTEISKFRKNIFKDNLLSSIEPTYCSFILKFIAHISFLRNLRLLYLFLKFEIK